MTSKVVDRSLPLLALLASGLLAACQNLGMSEPATTQAVAPARGETALVAPPPDPAAAREDARVIAQYGGRYSDPRLEEVLSGVVGRLVAASDNPSRRFRVTLLNSPVANAFALPSGSLYVTRGLVALANDSAELAAVLSHEMAHVLADHAEARAKAAEKVALVEGVATDVLGPGAESRLALSSSKLTLAKFSREQEVEADRLGIRISAGAGFDPYAASRLIDRLERYAAFRSALGAKDGANFLASHPAGLERRTLAASVAAQVAPSAASAGSDRDRYLGSLDGLVYGDDPSEGFVRGREYLHPRLAIGFRVPDSYRLENGKDAVLAAADRNTAMRFDGVTVAAGLSPADYLRSGWVNGLDEASVATSSLNGFPVATASATAGAWRFRIGAIKVGTGMFRLIFADRGDAGTIASDLKETMASFRRLSGADRARLRPLRIDIVSVGDGQTVADFAGRMRGTENGEQLFRLLNGLSPSDRLRAGQTVKIVID